MKRFVLSVDALRYDVAYIYQERFGGKLHKVGAVASWTLPVFAKWQEWMRHIEGNIALFAAGYPRKLEGWDDFVTWSNPGSIYPLFGPAGSVRDLKKVIEEGYNFILVHEYMAHNFYEELDWTWPTNLKASDKDRAWKAYVERVEHIANYFERDWLPLLREHSYEIFLTADHGEGFWDDGVHWHHGQEGHGGSMPPDYTTVTPEVMEIPILDFQSYDVEMTQEKILTGHDFTKESDDA